MGYVIGCDMGSQSLKGLLLSAEGRVAASASSSYQLSFPHPGWAEQNPRDWMKALEIVVTSLLASSGVRASEVKALGIASQVDGLVAVDRNGEALRPAIIWMDRRAEAQCEALAKRIPRERIFRITGLNLDSSHVANKILWLRDEEPASFRAMSGALLPGVYLVQKLTGERVIDHSNASSTMLYDVTDRIWSKEMLAAADLDDQLLGRISPALAIAGSLRPEAARRLGLAPGTKVVTGCGDEHAACLSAGLVAPGPICDVAGTAEPVCTATAGLVLDETGLVETHAHADPRWYLLENPGFVSGGSIRWFADVFGVRDYEEMFNEAGLVPSGSEGLVFLPCMSGAMTPVWNGKARGVFYGLTMKHGRGHLARAVIEGCTYALRDISDRFRALGLGSDEIRVTGGGARSALWCQIKADVTGRVIRTVREPESTAAGAAMLAGVAEGVYYSLDEAASQLVTFAGCYEPRPEAQAIYEESYAAYREVYAALDPIFTHRGHNECK
jgi:xylulokinase